MGDEDAAGPVGGAEEQRRHTEVPGDGRDAVGLHIQPVVQVLQMLGHGAASFPRLDWFDYIKCPEKGKERAGERKNLNRAEICRGGKGLYPGKKSGIINRYGLQAAKQRKGV